MAGWREPCLLEETAIDAGEMEVPSRWGAEGMFTSLDTDKPSAPPGCSPSFVTAATPLAEPEQMGHQQTRGCLRPVPKEPQHCFASLSIKPTKQSLIISRYQNDERYFKHSYSREEDLPTAALILGIYGAFMLPLINAAELFTTSQVAHHHACLHEHQTALTELTHRCDFSLAAQRSQQLPNPALHDQWQADRFQSKLCSLD